VRPHKQVILRRKDGREERIAVPQAELKERVARLVSEGDLVDLTVADPPLEDVMRELFAEKKVAS
jgi:ABC-2 type transport system ATP-binding protein